MLFTSAENPYQMNLILTHALLPFSTSYTAFHNIFSFTLFFILKSLLLLLLLLFIY